MHSIYRILFRQGKPVIYRVYTWKAKSDLPLKVKIQF